MQDWGGQGSPGDDLEKKVIEITDQIKKKLSGNPQKRDLPTVGRHRCDRHSYRWLQQYV